MTTPSDLDALQHRLHDLLHAKPTRPAWEKVCDHLDDWPEDHLVQATQLIDRLLAERWPDDLNPGWLWPLPPRQASRRWVRRLLKGDTPPAWHLVKLLQLHDANLGDKGLHKLLASPSLNDLTHLYLAQCKLGPQALHHLAFTPHLSSLTHLVLGGNPLGPDTLPPLLDAPFVSQLRLLDLGRSKLHTPDLRALLSAHLPLLHTLELGNTQTPTDDLAQLLLSAHLPSITTLSLGAFTSDLGCDLACDDRYPPQLRQALWRGWLVGRETAALKNVAARRSLPRASKLARPQLIDALAALPPTPL